MLDDVKNKLELFWCENLMRTIKIHHSKRNGMIIPRLGTIVPYRNKGFVSSTNDNIKDMHDRSCDIDLVVDERLC